MLKFLRLIRKEFGRIGTLFINRKIGLQGVTVNGLCKFNKQTSFGEQCHFNGVWVDGPGPVRFGNGCHFGRNITIFTQNHNYRSREKLPYDDTFIVKGVSFGNYVWVGSSVIILPGTTVGDGVIVQAGSVVHGTLDRCGIYGGNPAMKFGTRDIALFEELNQYAGH